MSAVSLAYRIRQIMRENGLTQQQLSEVLGISQPSVSLYLQGRMPPADVLHRIAQIGGASMEWLLTGILPGEEGNRVSENSVPYGSSQVFADLWRRLPSAIQQDMITLLRHIAEVSSGGKK